MGKRVLVVDDHPPMVKLIEDALVREGFSVLSAGDGRECMRKAQAERPDLIILDVVMPGMDGFKVLHLLRERPETTDIPVILLTVRKERGDVLTGWMAGANLYMTKPCNIGELVSAVKGLLGMPARV